MPDYSKGKIYKLVSNYTDDIYIGSTCNTLSRRKSGHKCHYMRYIDGKCNYISSFKLYEKGDVDIVLLESCSVNNKDELYRRERYFIENYNCINKYIPGRTKKQYYQANKDKVKKYQNQYKKKWCEDNKDKVKKYHQINKDKINQQRRQLYKNNKDKMKQYYIDNKDKVKEYKKQYYQKKKLESLNFALDSEI